MTSVVSTDRMQQEYDVLTLPTNVGMPKATDITMPDITSTASFANGGVPASGPGASGLTAQDLVQRLPSIVDSTVASVTPPGFASWVSENPLLALAAVVGLYFVVRGK